MLTGTLKNKIDSIWEMFWTGGIVNPLDVVEQMTYLMFIHDLDEVDTKKKKSSMMLELPYQSMFEGKASCRWSVFRDLPAEKMYELMQKDIFPFIKDLHGSKESAYSKYMSDAIFKIPTPQLLAKIVDALDGLYADMAKDMDVDTKGDVYESLLSKLATAGVNGQFRTPRHIIRMMVEMLAPNPDDIICDPACGTSGFLVAAGEYLKKVADVPYSTLGEYVDIYGYGNPSEVLINGKSLKVLPLAHPLQIGALGAHSEKWFNMHREWEEFLKN